LFLFLLPFVSSVLVALLCLAYIERSARHCFERYECRLARNVSFWAVRHKVLALMASTNSRNTLCVRCLAKLARRTLPPFRFSAQQIGRDTLERTEGLMANPNKNQTYPNTH
jgi:predicted component of type VI protein secretion system